MAIYNYEDAEIALDFLKKFLPFTPSIAITAGSGLGDIEEVISNKIILDVKDIPNWPVSTAPGHSGKIIAGQIEDRNIILLQGRVHYYEGYSLKAVTFPTRIMGMLGVKFFIATNAAGAINTSYSPGEIIAVKDHINLMGMNPLIGPNNSKWNERFPDMSHAYNPEILATLSSLGLRTGIYAAFMGPSFETPAEVKMAGILGADLAGMSTIPEVIVANAMNMKVCVLSCVANMAAGIEPDKTLTSQEVLDTMKISSHKLAIIIQKLIKSL